MYYSSLLGAFFVATVQQLASAQYEFKGQITHIGTQETDGIVLVTIENIGTGNYSIEARNNLFDDAYPYQPLSVKNLAGTRVALVGAPYKYGPLDDSAFINMGPGAIWQRELNMTGYIPQNPAVTKPSSECFGVSFPSDIYAVNTTDFVSAENLATGFLKNGGTQIFIQSTPLHVNFTVQPGQPAPAAVSTASVQTQMPASLIQGTATGVGAAAATYGSSIDSFIGADASRIFAKSGAQ